MKLYEVNRQLEELLLRLEPDPETGEIPADEDEILAEIRSLAMERADILRYIAKLALNTKSDVAALKEEEKRLRDRRQRMESRQERLVSLLDRECGGRKTDLGVATLSYRKSSRLEITDSAAVVDWLDTHGHHSCYRVPDPEISKSAVTKLLNSGEQIPGAETVACRSVYLR